VKIGLRWPEDEMRKWEVIFARALSERLSLNPKTVFYWKHTGRVTDKKSGPTNPRSTVLTTEEQSKLSVSFDVQHDFRWMMFLPRSGGSSPEFWTSFGSNLLMSLKKSPSGRGHASGYICIFPGRVMVGEVIPHAAKIAACRASASVFVQAPMNLDLF